MAMDDVWFCPYGRYVVYNSDTRCSNFPRQISEKARENNRAVSSPRKIDCQVPYDHFGSCSIDKPHTGNKDLEPRISTWNERPNSHSRSVRDEILLMLAYAPEELAMRLAALLQQVETCHPVVLRSRPELRGWAGLDLPMRVGGAAWSTLKMASLFRLCGRLDLELRDLPGSGHARLLTLAPTRDFDDFLRQVVTASSYCAIAITEPDVGSDIQSMSTTATPVRDGYRLDGRKEHIARINEASHFIIFAAVCRQAMPEPLITAFLVPRATAGLTVEPVQAMGMPTMSWGRVHLRNVAVPRSSRIGGEGQAMSLFQRHFSYWRTMMAAAAVGSAQTCVKEATKRMQTRTAFGGPIGRFSHLQQALAEHVARLSMIWLFIRNLASSIDSPTDRRPWPVFDAAMAKAEATEAAIGTTEWCMSVFGAAAYATELGIEKRYRDLVGLRFADGTTDVLRGQVARALLGERLYELSLSRNQVGDLDDAPRRCFW
jgi:alkylation response protein AidB-like acyl-CoA dehydrogenase